MRVLLSFVAAGAVGYLSTDWVPVLVMVWVALVCEPRRREQS